MLESRRSRPASGGRCARPPPARHLPTGPPAGHPARHPAPHPARHPLALELLVHGVAGAAPGELLGDPRTVRVTGDSTAAVFRRTEDADAEAHPERYAGRPVPEAYCWSRLTSGNGARALWLLLLPFMVANLAHWARPATPAADPAPRAVRTYGVLVRILALSLTVLLIAAACEVALDLLAWQCAGSGTCAGSPFRSWLGFLAPGGGWWAQPGRRLALGALVPAALTGLLWYLSNRTWSAYESQPPPAGAADPDTASDPVPALGRPGFWYGRRLVARLRAAHTAAGLLTVAVAVSVPTARHDRRAAPPPRGPRHAHPGPARRRGRRRGLGRLPARPHRGPARPPARPGRRHPAARRRARPARRRPRARLLVAPRLDRHRTAPRGPDLRRADAGSGALRASPGRRRPAPAPRGPRPGGRPARPGRARRRHARLRARRGDVRRGRPARRRLAGRGSHARNARRRTARAARAAVLAGRRAAPAAPRTGPARGLVRGARGPGAGSARRRRGRRVPGGDAGPGPQPPDRRGADRGRAHRLRALVRGGRLRDHPGARCGRAGRGLVQREGPGGGGPRDPAGAGGRRPRRPGCRVLAHRPGHRRFRRLGPPCLPGSRRPPDHRDPVGRRHLLAARRPPLRTALLRRAGRPRPHLADGRLDRPHRWPPRHLRPLPGQRARRGGRLAATAARPPPGRPAHLRIPARPSLRPLVPRLFRPRAAHRPASRGRLLAQPLAGHRPHRRPGPALPGAGQDVDRGPLADPLAYGRSARHPLPAPILGHGDYQADPAFAAERDALLARLDAAARADLPGQRLPVSKEWAGPAAPADPPGTAG